MGLQMILFHNLRDGIKMRWSNDLDGEPNESVDIAHQIHLALENANKSND
jgi:hypothetical protein